MNYTGLWTTKEGILSLSLFAFSLVKAKASTTCKSCICNTRKQIAQALDDMRTCVLADGKCSWLKVAIIWSKLPQREFFRLTQGTTNKTKTLKCPPATKTCGMFFYIIFHIKCNCRLTFIEKIFIQARYA